MLDNFNKLTRWNKGIFVLSAIFAGIFFISVLYLLKKSFIGEDSSLTYLLGVAISGGIGGYLSYLANKTINDVQNFKQCDSTIWNSIKVLKPTNFKSSNSNLISICDAQIIAQDDKKYAFILRKLSDNNYEYMSINSYGYEVTETDSEEYTVFYTKDAKLNIKKKIDCVIEWNDCLNNSQKSKSVTEAENGGKTCSELYTDAIKTEKGYYERNCSVSKV